MEKLGGGWQRKWVTKFLETKGGRATITESESNSRQKLFRYFALGFSSIFRKPLFSACTCLIIVPKLHPTRLKSILLNEEEGKTRREGSSSREEEEMILKERRDFERQRERERKRNKRLEKRFLTKGEKCIESFYSSRRKKRNEETSSSFNAEEEEKKEKKER